MKFTVKRKRWYRGETGVASRLLLDDGTMCCLGFLGQTCGIPDDAMLNQPSPAWLARAPWPEGLVTAEESLTLVGKHIVLVNDSAARTEQDREATLTQLFISIGIEVTFTDEEE